MYLCFFVFVFLNLLGFFSLITMFIELTLDNKSCPPTIISGAKCKMGLEYEVRSALLTNKGCVIVLLNEKCYENKEFMKICSLLQKDNPRVSSCPKKDLEKTIEALE